MKRFPAADAVVCTLRACLPFLTVLALTGAGGCDAPRKGSPGRFTVEAPDTELLYLDGRTTTLSALRGRVVLLNFWATFCPPCREEMPDFEALHRDYTGRGLSVVGISLDTVGPEQVRRFLATMGVTYPVAMGRFRDLEAAWGVLQGIPTFHGSGEDPPVSDNGSVYYIPSTFLIDPEGRIVEKHVGGRTRAQLEPAIRRLLASGTETAAFERAAYGSAAR